MSTLTEDSIMSCGNVLGRQEEELQSHNQYVKEFQIMEGEDAGEEIKTELVLMIMLLV